MYVGYHDANNMSNFGGDPVTQLNLKNVFVYEIGLIAIRKVSPPFDEEQIVPLEYYYKKYAMNEPAFAHFIMMRLVLLQELHSSCNMATWRHVAILLGA